MSATALVPISLAEAKRQAIVAALQFTYGDKDGAAYYLQIGRATLYRKLWEFEIAPGEYMKSGEQQ